MSYIFVFHFKIEAFNSAFLEIGNFASNLQIRMFFFFSLWFNWILTYWWKPCCVQLFSIQLSHEK